MITEPIMITEPSSPSVQDQHQVTGLITELITGLITDTEPLTDGPTN